MSKQKLFVDFDITIVDSIKAFTDTYNILYGDHPNFVPADPNKITEYNFKCICPLIKHSEDIFKNKLFFFLLKFINENTYEVLEKLNKKYRLIVSTIGTSKNLSLKSKWLESNLPFIKDYILIKNQGCKMDKSLINMGKDSIFIDDIPSNLESSNAERKILFGKIYPWNENWQGEHCLTWKEIEQMLL